MTQKVRGFEWINKFAKQKEEFFNKLEGLKESQKTDSTDRQEEYYNILELPKRSTGKSAGYDFMAIEYTTVPSIWKQASKFIFNKVFSGGKEVDNTMFKPTLVATGVKAYMQDDEYLALYNRSSNPLKRLLLMANGVGVVDADYYDNDGHIMFQFINFGISDYIIEPGDVIGQGIFQEFRKADLDSATKERTGGFGSTDSGE